ncbi:hypothetical protein CFK41_07315 [Brachybacterium ginsengisoli]|uniref:Low molecular weight protein antigen 6 PH domain-containing protein n=1 Tax=Brachybacterium ginsengisoli TaxID=1331682 RepID=A0A291GWK8_9MICO|nr:PH domain-containing protein [Brachybacterium ginsengisoli]ATG54593.1 hypothetical protein CFK41_07315 [Brachybacterium ginsengisoli]
MTPAAPPAQILYTARPALWARILLIAVGVGIVLMVGPGAVALLVAEGGPSPWGWAALGLSLPFLLVVVVLVVLAQRPRFTVTTSGIEIRTPLRTRRLPWQDIALIEVDEGWIHQGQTMVVLRDGRRIGAPITAARSAMRRGERTSDHGPGLRGAARPTRAAIDAHRRWLSGDLGPR